MPPTPAEPHRMDCAVLVAMIQRYSFLTIASHDDTSSDPDCMSEQILFDGTLRAGGKRVVEVRMTPQELADAVLGTETARRCPKCKLAKSPEDFSRDATVPAGRVYRCKVCERERVGAYQRKRRELERNVRAMAEGVRPEPPRAA